MRKLSVFIIIIIISSLFTVGVVVVWITILNPNDTSFKLTSPAFANESSIPIEFTCGGENINPPLNIENVPEGTLSLALIMEDPDAASLPWVGFVFLHWVVWNIDPKTTAIEKNSTPLGAVVGVNHFHENNYGGPCPPAFRDHRYFFTLYTLTIELNLKSDCSKGHLLDAMEGHIIDQVLLIGIY
jgi:Raf kinase inhibitor-like YbhB/YbcL family protein